MILKMYQKYEHLYNYYLLVRPKKYFDSQQEWHFIMNTLKEKILDLISDLFVGELPLTTPPPPPRILVLVIRSLNTPIPEKNRKLQRNEA